MKKPFKDNSNLNVMKKIFLAVMVLFLMTSCWEKVYDEGGGYYDHISYRGSNKYWYSIYTIPSGIMIDFPIWGEDELPNYDDKKRDSCTFRVEFRRSTSVYTTLYNEADFKKYANIYHEKGDANLDFYGYTKPVGIEYIHAYLYVNYNLLDADDNILIRYRNDSVVIANHYAKEIQESKNRWIEKKVNQLTAQDLKWMPYRFYFDVIDKKVAVYVLRIKLTNGKIIWNICNAGLLPRSAHAKQDIYKKLKRIELRREEKEKKHLVMP